MRLLFTAAVLLALTSIPALGQTSEIEVGELTCLPNEENAALRASVSPEIGGGSVRLYFRRLNPEGTFYYNHFFAEGDGGYWTVFPKPEDREQNQLDDEWWEILKDRDWLEGRDREWLEDFLDEREHELAEYYVAVHDNAGERVTQSPLRLVEVFDQDDCEPDLDEFEDGWAENLTIGETREDQYGDQVYHWLCDGIVTRIDPSDVIRADEFCRACVVALLPGWVVPTAAAIAGGGLATVLLDDSDDPPASPSRP